MGKEAYNEGKLTMKCMTTEDRLAEIIREIEKDSNIQAIVGERIEKGGVTVIPIGRVSKAGGFGAGGDVQADDKPEQPGYGYGMGYSRQIEPMGYIEISDGKVTYSPIINVGKLVTIGAVFAGVAGLVGLKFLLKNTQGKKK